jgi:hypothetical protein
MHPPAPLADHDGETPLLLSDGPRRGVAIEMKRFLKGYAYNKTGRLCRQQTFLYE